MQLLLLLDILIGQKRSMQMFKIIATGPESSGKTTICEAISKKLKIPFSREQSRKYISNLSRKYHQRDLVKIAKMQLAKEEGIRILDTDLITIKIWSEYKYKKCNKWIIEQIEKQKKENRFYLLCKPDIPWVYDPLRENQKERNKLFEIYKKELERLSHNYFIVEGKDRLEKSLSKIIDLII